MDQNVNCGQLSNISKKCLHFYFHDKCHFLTFKKHSYNKHDKGSVATELALDFTFFLSSLTFQNA